MAQFAKNEQCPSSSDLHAFQLGDLSVDEGRSIRDHLPICEFCSAEVDFYSRYPMEPVNEAEAPAAMPDPLRRLAEALLRDNSDRSTLKLLLQDASFK